jgi:pSer/pThr/pTyr-binding forkhead associated (FHA) protein
MIDCLTFKTAEVLMTATALRLTVAGNHRYAAFPLPVEEICLGRCDASRGIFPDLDLGPDGGYAGGVSRRHARIFQRYGRLFVEDAGSTNGTLLNDCRLIPHLPYRLQEGDTLQLGTLKLVVGFD